MGCLSFSYSFLKSRSFPVLVKSVPRRAFCVGNLLSKQSTPLLMASTSSRGFPAPMR